MKETETAELVREARRRVSRAAASTVADTTKVSGRSDAVAWYLGYMDALNDMELLANGIRPTGEFWNDEAAH